MYIEVNLFRWRVTSKQWLPGETGEHTQLHLAMSTERTPSHAEANWFARGWTQAEQPSPCWLSSQRAQQHSGLDPPLQGESDVPSPWLTTSTCSACSSVFGLVWIHPAEREWLSHPPIHSGSSRQMQLNTVPCFLLFLHFLWHSWASWFSVNAWTPQKSWWKQWELLKDLRPPRGVHTAHPSLQTSCTKKAMQHSMGSQEDNNQPARSPSGKVLVKSPWSNTSSTYLQIHTKSQRMPTETQPFAIPCLL